MARKVLKWTRLALVALFVIGGVGIYLYASEPMDDMRHRADALSVPSNFVLVSESYSAGAMGFMGSIPVLQRTYHALWSGVCDSLQSIRDRSGEPLDMAGIPPDLADQICEFGAWCPAGWLGWCRNYRHYELRLSARAPEMIRKMGPLMPRFEVLYPKPNDNPGVTFTIPDGRAMIDVELIALRGR